MPLSCLRPWSPLIRIDAHAPFESMAVPGTAGSSRAIATSPSHSRSGAPRAGPPNTIPETLFPVRKDREAIDTRKSGRRQWRRAASRIQLSQFRRSGDTGAQRERWPYFGALVPYLDRACLRFSTPRASSAPRMMWYRTPGRSFTRPPRISTIECSWRLCPSPGM